MDRALAAAIASSEAAARRSAKLRVVGWRSAGNKRKSWVCIDGPLKLSLLQLGRIVAPGFAVPVVADRGGDYRG